MSSVPALSLPATITNVDASESKKQPDSSQVVTSATLPTIGAGRIQIYFSNDVTGIYNQSDLQQFAFFKNDKSPASKDTVVRLQNIAYHHFKIIFALVCNNKPMHQAIALRQITPTLYEDLVAALQVLQPTTAVAERIKNSLPYLLTLEASQTLMKVYCSIKPQSLSAGNSSSSSSSSTSSLLSQVAETSQLATPLLVGTAQKIIFLSKCFRTAALATNTFIKMRTGEIQIEFGEQYLGHPTTKLIDPGAVDMTTLQKAIKDDKKEQASFCRSHYLEFTFANLPLVVRKLSLQRQRSLSLHTNDEDPMIKRGAELAQIELAVYREEAMEALRTTKADTSRKDLLDYLIGPKAYLLIDYGISLDATSKKFPFTYAGKPFTFNLNNSSASALESELRTELSSRGASLTDHASLIVAATETSDTFS